MQETTTPALEAGQEDSPLNETEIESTHDRIAEIMENAGFTFGPGALLREPARPNSKRAYMVRGCKIPPVRSSTLGVEKKYVLLRLSGAIGKNGHRPMKIVEMRKSVAERTLQLVEE